MRCNNNILPVFIKKTLRENAKLLGISSEEFATYHILHSLAILDAGISLCGEPLLNPIRKTQNWNQLYHHIKTAYERVFVSSKLIKERSD